MDKNALFCSFFLVRSTMSPGKKQCYFYFLQKIIYLFNLKKSDSFLYHSLIIMISGKINPIFSSQIGIYRFLQSVKFKFFQADII